MALGQLTPEAAALMNLCAFLAPDDIPRNLIEGGKEHLPEPLAACVDNPLALNEAIANLRSYSLLEITGDSWSLHRLVQAVVRDKLEVKDREAWTEVVLGVVEASYPDEVLERPGTWPACARLLNHAITTTDFADSLQVARETTFTLLDRIGGYFRVRAEYPRAREVRERALAIAEATYGPEHPTVYTRLNNLAGVLRAQGDLAGAKEMYERSLAADEATYGLEHPTVAIRLNNLAGVLQNQRDLVEAKELFERALAIDEETYGLEHPTVATRLNNLANVLREQGDLVGAKERYERALKILVEWRGEEHPYTVSVRQNLGRLPQA